MTNKRYKFEPDYKVSPGEILNGVLETNSISNKEFADRCGLSEEVIDNIINDEQFITPKIAMLFSCVTCISEGFWLELERQYKNRNEESDKKLFL